MRSSLLKNQTVFAVMAFLTSHWRRELRLVLLIAATMGLSTVADLLLPVLSGRLVDAVSLPGHSRTQAVQEAIRALGWMTGLGLVLISSRHVAFIGVSHLTTRVMSRVASDSFWRVTRMSTEWHANNFAGSLVRRITRGMWAIDLLDDTLLLSLFPALLALTGSAVVLGTHWISMGLLVAFSALVFIAVSAWLSLGYVAPSARLSNAQDTRIGGALADAITCNAVVKSFGAEDREDSRLAHTLTKWRSRTFRSWVLGTRSGTAQLTLLLLLRTSVIGYGLLLWWRGLATAGDLTFVLTSYFIVHGYLRDIGHHVASLQRGVNEMEDVVTLRTQPLGIQDVQGAQSLQVTRGDIHFEDITFRYGGHRTPLFSEFSVHIRPGERVGLVGHSGSGKTTFVKLLLRLYDVNEGRICIDGQNIALTEQSSVRAQLALVPQEPILFHRSLAENIAYGRPNASLQEIEQAAALASADGFIRRQPKGYQTLVGERGVKLSGGERQRIALARAFLANAPVLILDEATSSLDSESEAAIQSAMERLMSGRTSIVIAHRLSTVRMLDRILVFDAGRIVEEGSHDELIRRSGGIYRNLFEKQALGLVPEHERLQPGKVIEVNDDLAVAEPA